MYDRLQANYRVLFEGQPAPIFYKYFYPTGNNHDVLWDLFNYSRGLKKDKARDDEQYEVYSSMVDTSDNSEVNLYEYDLRNFLNAVYADTGRTRNAGIIAIPSSNAGKVNRVTEIIRSIMRRTPGVYTDLTNNIYRVRSKDAAHGGGNRSVEGNINTLGSRRPYEIRNLDLIIVVDDIVTSGSSFRAMYEFLRRTGFRGQVINFAYARHFPSEVVETYYKYDHRIEYEAFEEIRDLRAEYEVRPAWNNEGNEVFGVIYDLDQTLIDDSVRDIDFEETLWQSSMRQPLPYRIYDGIKELMELPIASAIVSNRPMKQIEKLFEYREIDTTLTFPEWDRTGLLRPVFSFPEEQRGEYTTRFYKPHPGGVSRAYLHLDGDYGLTGCRIVGVGNTVEDIIAYKACGMEALLALWGIPTWLKETARSTWQADYVFESPDELRQWLDARLSKPDYYEMGLRIEDRDKRAACKYYELALQNNQSVMQAAFRYASLISDEEPEKAIDLYWHSIYAGDECAATNNLALLIEGDDPKAARKLYERSIAAGSLKIATRNLALLIMEQEPDKAVELLRQAAENGNVTNLESDLRPLMRKGVAKAVELYREHGTGTDEAKAKTIATLVAEAETEQAKILLEQAIESGDETHATRQLALLIRDTEPERAVELLGHAAKAGNASELLSDLKPLIASGDKGAIQLYDDIVVAKDGKMAFYIAINVADHDKELAKAYYERAIAAGDEYASTGNLANLICADEPDRARVLYERAIAAGEEHFATCNLGNLIAKEDANGAIALYERAIAAGDKYYAPRNLALLIMKQDPARAIELLEIAATNGNKSNLTYDLEPEIRKGNISAIRLFERVIIADDETKAAVLANFIVAIKPVRAESLYRRAIAAGDNLYAPNDLAMLIERRKPEEAERLYRRAMDAGDRSVAPNNLGALIVVREPETARMLFEQSIEGGDAIYATCNLAHTYLPTDQERAIELYEQSLDSGDETEAKLGLAYLLTETQPERAEELKRQAYAAQNMKKSFDFMIKVISAFDCAAAHTVTRYFLQDGYQDAWVTLAKLTFGEDFDEYEKIVTFGTDAGTENRIPWMVVGPVGGGLLLLSKYTARKMPFVVDASEATWGISSVRQWLNGEFLKECFTDEERGSLVKHPELDDKVFCLSELDLDETMRQALGGSFAAKASATNVPMKWWLRPVKGGTLSAPCIDENGDSCWVLALVEHGVRPAVIYRT